MMPAIEKFTRRGLRGKRWYFRLVASNGETVAQSEGYNSKAGRDHGVAVVSAIASSGRILDND